MKFLKFCFSFDLVYPQLTPINTSLQISITESENSTSRPRNDPNRPYLEFGVRESRKMIKNPKFCFSFDLIAKNPLKNSFTDYYYHYTVFHPEMTQIGYMDSLECVYIKK